MWTTTATTTIVAATLWTSSTIGAILTRTRADELAILVVVEAPAHLWDVDFGVFVYFIVFGNDLGIFNVIIFVLILGEAQRIVFVVAGFVSLFTARFGLAAETIVLAEDVEVVGATAFKEGLNLRFIVIGTGSSLGPFHWLGLLVVGSIVSVRFLAGFARFRFRLRFALLGLFATCFRLLRRTLDVSD